jgi:hypothetical protein
MAMKLMGFEAACYGWVPDLPDHRNPVYAASVGLAAGTGLRSPCPPMSLRKPPPGISGQSTPSSDNASNPNPIKPENKL